MGATQGVVPPPPPINPCLYAFVLGIMDIDSSVSKLRGHPHVMEYITQWYKVTDPFDVFSYLRLVHDDPQQKMRELLDSLGTGRDHYQHQVWVVDRLQFPIELPLHTQGVEEGAHRFDGYFCVDVFRSICRLPSLRATHPLHAPIWICGSQDPLASRRHYQASLTHPMWRFL